MFFYIEIITSVQDILRISNIDFPSLILGQKVEFYFESGVPLFFY